MARLLGYFARGLVLLAPVVVTAWVCWLMFTSIDGWLGLPVRGVGFVATLVLITAVGAIGSSLLSRSAVTLFERLLSRLPFVRLLYGSTKELLNAFVGEKRRFDKPVLVAMDAAGAVRLVGFVTQATLDHVGLPGDVAIYSPHSYAWAGQLLIVPSSRVTPLDAASADTMAFIVSGGVSGLVPKALSKGEFASTTPES